MLAAYEAVGAASPSAVQQNVELKQAVQTVLVTTGDVQAKYQPLDVVFAVGGSAGGVFRSASPQQAFEEARRQLQVASVALGGNAVVACRFQYESQVTQFLGCSTTNFVVTGYGTVVRFL